MHFLDFFCHFQLGNMRIALMSRVLTRAMRAPFLPQYVSMMRANPHLLQLTLWNVKQSSPGNDYFIFLHIFPRQMCLRISSLHFVKITLSILPVDNRHIQILYGCRMNRWKTSLNSTVKTAKLLKFSSKITEVVLKQDFWQVCIGSPAFVDLNNEQCIGSPAFVDLNNEQLSIYS